MAKTVVFDFDGVIHSYISGWQGEDNIPDPPVQGIREALKEIHDAGYEIMVVSTRCATIRGHGAIETWLYDNGLREYIDKVCKEKPPAIAYIDDRAICFDGHPETLLKKIQNFQPWYKMPTLTQPNEDGKDKNVPINDPLTLEELTLMIEPTPVWWDWVQGWVLARKGMIISWNGVYYNFDEVKGNFYRRPPEEPLTCEGCVHEINEHENCNYCIRAGYLGDYYYRSQDVLKNE